MGEFEAKKSKIRVFHADHHVITMLDSRRVLSFLFFLSCFFSLRTDEMFFVLFLQFVDSVGYCLEDQKSGTVELAFFTQLYAVNQSPL